MTEPGPGLPGAGPAFEGGSAASDRQAGPRDRTDPADEVVTGGSPRPLIVIAGATATGKSALAIALARHVNGEIINADAMQLYRGMDIGTAKVTAAEREAIPHHQLDVLEVTEEASVARYQQLTRGLVAQIRQRGRTPLLVGGSGLYVRAAIDAIEFPPTDAALRDELTERLHAEGPDVLREELRALDPASAETIRDARRLVRALEVVRLSGRPFAAFMPRRAYHPSMEPVIQFGVRVPRPVLHERIHHRVRDMAAAGFLEEVRQLDARGLRDGATASQAIGYRQFLEVLDGIGTEAQAIESTAQATRKLARRQETWFRADPRMEWLHSDAATDPDLQLADLKRQALRRLPGGEDRAVAER